MRIKDASGAEHNVTGQGQGIYNTIGASAGILSLLGGAGGGNCGCGNGGGLFGGLFGGGCNDNGCCDHVSQKELIYSTELAACRGREYALNVAREESAAIFAESRRTDDKIAGVVKDTTGAVITIGNAVSGLDKEVACLKVLVDRNREDSFRNLKEAKEYTDCRVNAEAQLRKCGDDNIVAWTQAELNKKIDGVMKIDGDEIAFGRCRPILEQCPCGTPANPINVKVIEEAAAAAAIAAVKAMK